MIRAEREAGAIDAVRAALDDLEQLSRLPDAAVRRALVSAAELARLVDAMRVRLAAEVAERSLGPAEHALCRRLGHVSAKAAVASAFGLRGGQAADLLAIAAATSPRVGVSGGELPARYPQLGAALADGGLSLPQAHAILGALEPAAPRADLDDLAWAEAALVAAATDPGEPLGPELLAERGRLFAARLDPDGVLPKEEQQRAMRSLTTSRRRDGMWRTVIISPPEEGSATKGVLDAHAGPRVPVRFADPDAPGSEEGLTDRGLVAADGRTRQQLLHDVAVGIFRQHAASGDAPTAGGEAPVLVLHGSAEALRAAFEGIDHRERFARIEHTGDLIPIEVGLRMLCDAKVQLARTCPVDEHHDHPHVLALGRAQRLFNRAQRRALALRDKGCRAPGCTMPPAWCEAHHVIPWLAGGPTDIDNGILLCAFHHHEVHAGRLRVERAGPEPGSWRVVGDLQPLRRTTAWKLEQQVLARRAEAAAPSIGHAAARSRAVLIAPDRPRAIAAGPAEPLGARADGSDGAAPARPARASRRAGPSRLRPSRVRSSRVAPRRVGSRPTSDVAPRGAPSPIERRVRARLRPMRC